MTERDQLPCNADWGTHRSQRSAPLLGGPPERSRSGAVQAGRWGTDKTGKIAVKRAQG